MQIGKDAGMYRGRLEGKVLVIEVSIEAYWQQAKSLAYRHMHITAGCQAKRQTVIEEACIEAGRHCN